MANAKRDENYIPTIIGALDSDGTTPVLIKADPTTHAVNSSDAITGSDNSATNEAIRDDNYVPGLLAVSDADGETPVQIYVDTNGNLLIDTN